MSRPVRSGKTTELTEWLKDKDVIGLLTPDANSRRVLINIENNEATEFEVDEHDQRATVKIGKFHFLEDTFAKARSLLLQSVDKQTRWLVVDEVGKLEVLQHQGFEPALSSIIEHYKATINRKLLLVIRDSLLETAITKYALQDAMVMNDLKSLM